MSPPGRPALTLGAVAEHVGGSLVGAPDVSVTGVAGIDEAGPTELTFVSNARYRGALGSTRAAGVLVATDLECPEGVALIRVADPYTAMMRVLLLFDPGPPPVAPGVHPTALVDETAELGADTAVGPFAIIEAGARVGRGTRISAHSIVGENAVLGENCYLYPRTYVGRRCILGNRIILYTGAVIGSDGFGYAPTGGQYFKIPQLGIVVLEDDVEVGANACVDRSTMGRTLIGRGTKLDNLVQIAHNVTIGEWGVIAGLTGVAGSTHIGKRVRLGGQVGIVGHLRLGDDVSAGAQTGIIGSVPDGVTLSGYPGRPHIETMRSAANLKKVPDLIERVKALEARVRKEEEGEDA